MALNAKVLSVIAGCILGLSFIFLLLAMRFHHGDVEDVRSKVGLWKGCVGAPNLLACSTLDCSKSESGTGDDCSKLLAARAFVTLACIASAISALCLFFSATTAENMRDVLLLLGKVLAFASLVMGIIGVPIGIDVSTQTSALVRLGWGAGSIIGIIAIIMNLVGAIVSILIK